MSEESINFDELKNKVNTIKDSIDEILKPISEKLTEFQTDAEKNLKPFHADIKVFNDHHEVLTQFRSNITKIVDLDKKIDKIINLTQTNQKVCWTYPHCVIVSLIVAIFVCVVMIFVVGLGGIHCATNIAPRNPQTEENAQQHANRAVRNESSLVSANIASNLTPVTQTKPATPDSSDNWVYIITSLTVITAFLIVGVCSLTILPVWYKHRYNGFN